MRPESKRNFSSSVICLYAWWSMDGIEILRDMLNAVTGAGYSNEDLLEVGDRIWYIKRAIDNLCGVTSEDDTIPERLLKPHLEGEATDYTRVLYPMMSSMTRTKIHQEKVVAVLKKFSRDILMPRLFKTINAIGRVIPWVGRAEREMYAGETDDKDRVVDFKTMIGDFYRLRQFDKDGFPARKRLEKLGLSDVADVLERKRG